MRKHFNRLNLNDPHQNLDQRIGSFTAGDIHRFQGARVKVTLDFHGINKGTTGLFRDGVREPGSTGWMASIEWTSGPHSGKTDALTRNEFVTYLAFAD